MTVRGTLVRVLDWASGRDVVYGFLVGVLWGLLVLGMGGRLAMSIIAFALGLTPEWSFAGSMQVIVLGWALGPPAGLLYVAIERRLPGARWVKGLIFGVVFGALLVTVYFLRPAGPIELRSAPVLGGILFGALLVLFGIVLAASNGWFARYSPDAQSFHPAVGGLIAIAAVGCAGLALFALVSR